MLNYVLRMSSVNVTAGSTLTEKHSQVTVNTVISHYYLPPLQQFRPGIEISRRSSLNEIQIGTIYNIQGKNYQ